MAAVASSSADPPPRARKDQQVHCDYCRSTLTSTLHIKCAVCKDFVLCLSCFAAGKAVYPHVKTHAYRLMHRVSAPVFESDWGAEEELTLLEAIELYGLGNWQEAANHLGTKPRSQVEDHYDRVYLKAATAPLPDLTLPLPPQPKTDPASLSAAAALAAAAAQQQQQQQQQASASSSSSSAAAAGGASSAAAAAGVGAGAGGASAGGAGGAGGKPKSSLAALVGYIEKRGDFETEYDNDAETVIADMEFREEDTLWERALKLKQLEIYNRKLDGRVERKEFVVSRRMLQRKERRRGPDEREVHNNMRVFARFQSEAEHEEMVQGLVNERRLRQRIEQLQHYRLNGIRTLAEGAAFEADKQRRESQLSQKRSRELFQNGDDDRARLLLARLHQTGAVTADASVLVGVATGAGAAAGAAAGASSSSTSSSAMSDDAKGAAGAGAGAGAAGTGKRRKDGTGAGAGGHVEVDLAASSAAATGAGAGSTGGHHVFDVTGMPGADQLSPAERALCSELRLFPQHYFMVKERIVRESIAHGFLQPGQARQLVRVDINSTDKIVDFFVSTGWYAPLAPAQSHVAGGVAAGGAAAAGAGSHAGASGKGGATPANQASLQAKGRSRQGR